jgi:hypothetical protein
MAFNFNSKNDNVDLDPVLFFLGHPVYENNMHAVFQIVQKSSLYNYLPNIKTKKQP